MVSEGIHDYIMEEIQGKVQNVLLANNLKPLCLTTENGVASDCANSEKWKRWKQKFEIYVEANDLEKVSEKKKLAIFLNAIGDTGLEIYNSFNVDRTTETLKSVVEKFDSKFNACKNETVERYNFFTRIQKFEETFDEYVTSLNNLSCSCNFDTLKESLVKDMFIIGIRNANIKEKLLQRKIADVNEAVEIAKTIELSYQRSKKLGTDDIHEVKIIAKENVKKNPVSNRHRSMNRNSFRSKSHERSISSSSANFKTPHNFNRNRISCRRCGQIHRFKCPAFGKICTTCKKPNHFAQYCFFKNKQVSSVKSNLSESNSNINVNDCEQNNSNFIINSIDTKNKSCNKNNWQIELKCHNILLNCQIDTGADINVISFNTLQYLEKTLNSKIPIQKSHNKIFTFSGDVIFNLGSKHCHVILKISNKLIFNLWL
ncbi:hypothetical protein O3G_MSEX000343 [Manduca sexta]|nr:hypothetical protein O3G_MSEX000343 [Manduca sexta]